MEKSVRGLLRLVSRRHLILVHPDLLFKCFPELIRDPKVGQCVFDLLDDWTEYVKKMPEGSDQDCQKEMLRFSKGMLKAWRLWAVRKEMESTSRPAKRKQLKQRLMELQITRFSQQRNLMKSRPPKGDRLSRHSKSKS